MGGPTIKQRLTALAGMVAIVGAAVGALIAAGLIGDQGGGAGIENALVFDPPRAAAQADLDAGPRVGKLAPDFEVSDMDGTRYKLSDFRGKVVYVNFWATWCIPCQIEMPEMFALQEQFPSELAVISVNRREPVDRASAFLRNLPRVDGGTGVSYTVNGMDPDDTLYTEYRALGMPASIFVDPNGVITKVFNGLINLEIMEATVVEAAAVELVAAISD